MPKVLLLIHGNEDEWDSLGEADRDAVRGQYMDFAQRARAAGKLLDGAELEPTTKATTVRVIDGEAVVTDGPYAETKEQLGGFFLVDVESRDEAVELALQLPKARTGGGVQVHPAYEEEATS